MKRLLLACLLLACSLLPMGCNLLPASWLHKQGTPTPSPTATLTPIPEKDRLGFIQNGQLMTVRLDGSELATLYSRRKESVWFPCAGRDGSHFLAWISRPDGTQNLARIDAKTGAARYLTAIFAKARPEMKNSRLGNAPAYNPAGTKIAYSFNGDIWLMDADGYNAVTLVADHCSWSPAFSPDGKKIAYVNARDGRTQLWVTNVEDRDSYQVTDFDEYSVGHPQWTSNGNNVLFTKSQKDTSQLALVLVTGLTDPLVDSNPITKDEHSQGGEFSPDGLRIIYSLSKNGQEWNLWIANASGGDAMVITRNCQAAIMPTWLHPTGLAAAGPVRTPTPQMPSGPPPVQRQAVATPVPAAAPQAAAPAVPAAQPAAAQAASREPPQASAPVKVPAPVPTAAPAVAAAPEKPVPTQPPVKMAPLKLHVFVTFEKGGTKIIGGLPSIKTAAARIKQYTESEIHVRGPMDMSPLSGKYASAGDRSRARAEAVRKVLAKESGITESRMSTAAYSPPVLGAGSGGNNILQIYIDLK